MKVTISTTTETKNNNFSEHKQVQVKYGVNEYKFVCLNNNMARPIEEKIYYIF